MFGIDQCVRLFSTQKYLINIRDQPIDIVEEWRPYNKNTIAGGSPATIAFAIRTTSDIH